MTTAAPRCSVLLRHAFTHSAGCLGRGRSLGAFDALSGLAERAGSRFKPDPGPVLGTLRVCAVSPLWKRSQFPTWLTSMNGSMTQTNQ